MKKQIILFVTIVALSTTLVTQSVMAQNASTFHSKTLDKLLTHERFEKCWEKEKSTTGIIGDTIDGIKASTEKITLAGNVTMGPPDYTPNSFLVDIEDCMLGLNH